MNLPEINAGLHRYFGLDVERPRLDSLLTLLYGTPVLDTDSFTGLFPDFYETDGSLADMIESKYGKGAVQFVKEACKIN